MPGLPSTKDAIASRAAPESGTRKSPSRFRPDDTSLAGLSDYSDVDHSFSAEFRKVVSTDDRVVMAPLGMIYTRLELNQILDVRIALPPPTPLANNAAKRQSSLSVAAGQLLKYFPHPILIEAAIPKIGVCVCSKLELPALSDGRQIDPGGR